MPIWRVYRQDTGTQPFMVVADTWGVLALGGVEVRGWAREKDLGLWSCTGRLGLHVQNSGFMEERPGTGAGVSWDK